MFEYIESGYLETIILFPGWGFDSAIFNESSFNCNLIHFRGKLTDKPVQISDKILNKIKKHRIKVLVWSLGLQLANDFIVKYIYLIDSLILISTRKSYPAAELKIVKEKLKENPEAFLYKFYKNCFSSSKAAEKEWFRKKLRKKYLSKNSKEYLLSVLKCLTIKKIDFNNIKKIQKIRILHGEKDRIVPVEEAYRMKEKIVNANLSIIEDEGHLPFLNESCIRIINNE